MVGFSPQGIPQSRLSGSQSPFHVAGYFSTTPVPEFLRFPIESSEALKARSYVAVPIVPSKSPVIAFGQNRLFGPKRLHYDRSLTVGGPSRFAHPATIHGQTHASWQLWPARRVALIDPPMYCGATEPLLQPNREPVGLLQSCTWVESFRFAPVLYRQKLHHEFL